jgi:hypothetical protein
MEYGINDNRHTLLRYNIPIVLFSFKRLDKIMLIIERLSIIEPHKLYLISDGGRTLEEHVQIEKNRKKIEECITWKCEFVKRYASKNIGVYENIAGGAKWVFEREECAIFLEDDNLPELSFFPFCEEILELYKEDTRVLWICGTNYLKEYEPADHSSYIVTRHMIPCGWASWKNKFIKFYDGELELLNDPYISNRIRKEKYYKSLMSQNWSDWTNELRRKKEGKSFLSWDYQMSFSMRVHGLMAVVPKYNQITNIGVDAESIHEGFSYESVMTQRFCGIPTRSLEFPLVHPKALLIDEKFELQVAKIVTLPLKLRLKNRISALIKKLLGFEHDTSLKQKLISEYKKS